MIANKSELDAIRNLLDFAASCHQSLVFSGEHVNKTPPQVTAVRALLKKDSPKPNPVWPARTPGGCLIPKQMK